MTYAIVEPHPHPATSYVHTGRGGAGNAVSSTQRVRQTSPAHRQQSEANNKAHNRLFSSKPSADGRITTGRGGAGNVHWSSERAIFSFDEEISAQRSREEHAAPVFHVGRGGAGNTDYLKSSAAAAAAGSSAASQRGRPSFDSVRKGRLSEDSGVFHRVGRSTSHNS